jgi:cysteinyl-tRNA synthetase
MTPTLRLYDRMRDSVVDVEPSTPGPLRVYSCGPTVYGRIHVGNARPYWTAMVLKRASEQLLDLPVQLAINITDVNDKIYFAAAQQGVPSAQLAGQMTDAYLADTEALGLGRPDLEPLASESIPEIVALIERLIERGAAYASGDGDVYFSVAAYPQYGQLSGQRPDELVAGSRIEPGEGKRSPLDFALWKANKPGEDTAWDSPWGRGRPGWHIECSAMAREQLGENFDVHGGGIDLIFPHHENERAQAEAAGERFARVWMHNGMLRLTGEKMSKSLGNIEGLAEALERVGRETLLVFFAQAHYRSPVDYSETTLEQAAATAAGLREALRNARRYAAAGGEGSEAAFRDAKVREQAEAAFDRFEASMADDLDTPRGLAELHGLARDINVAVAGGEADPEAVGYAGYLLAGALDVLGLASLGQEAEVSAEALALAQERAAARAAGDFARADELRDRIAGLGFAVRDTPQGPQVVPLDD